MQLRKAIFMFGAFVAAIYVACPGALAQNESQASLDDQAERMPIPCPVIGEPGVPARARLEWSAPARHGYAGKAVVQASERPHGLPGMDPGTQCTSSSRACREAFAKRHGLKLQPSIGGPALEDENGQKLGTLGMLGLPAGTMLIPSAVGPLMVGRRGEFRGSLESYGTSVGPPFLGVGPKPCYNCNGDLGRLRNMFAPTPFPLDRAVVTLPARSDMKDPESPPGPKPIQLGKRITAYESGFGVQEYSFAKKTGKIPL